MRIEINGEYLPNHYQLSLLHDLAELLPDCYISAEVFNHSAKVRVSDRHTHEFTVGYIANVEHNDDWEAMYKHVGEFFAATYSLMEEEATHD